MIGLLKNIKNDEVIKSIVYLLENRYPKTQFSFDAKTKMLSLANLVGEKKLASPPQSEIEAFIRSMLNRRERLIDRVMPDQIDSYKSDMKGEESVPPISDIIGYEQNGFSMLGPEAYRIATLLDLVFLKFAREMGARECQVPSLISLDDLKKCGYLKGENPNISYLHRSEGSGEFVSDCTCLSPAVCLTLYPALAGNMYNEPTIFTIKGNAYRREGRSVRQSSAPLSRLWEFQVREIVFFGDQIFHDKIRKRYFDFLSKLGRQLNVSFEITSASDLFFQVDDIDVTVHQLLTKSKYEFIFVGDDTKLALASFNTHSDKFVKEFSISGYSPSFQSFCIAFGVHRWIQALNLTRRNFIELESTLKEIANAKS